MSGDCCVPLVSSIGKVTLGEFIYKWLDSHPEAVVQASIPDGSITIVKMNKSVSIPNAEIDDICQ